MDEGAFRNSFVLPPTISSGSLYLDQALCIGGIPRGSIIEISGESLSGKSILCYHILAEAQKNDGVCALIDSDLSFDPNYSAQCGIADDRLYLSQINHAEDALDILDQLANSRAFSAIILDSLTSLVPKTALNAPIGSQVDEGIEEILSKKLPHLISALQRSQTALVITHNALFGMSRVYHELKGHLDRLALPLAAAIHLKLERADDRAEDQPLRKIQVQITKNQFAPCFKSLHLDIIVNRRLNKTGELIDLGERLAVLTRLGAKIYYHGNYLGSSLEEVNLNFQSNPDLTQEIERKVRQAM